MSYYWWCWTVYECPIIITSQAPSASPTTSPTGSPTVSPTGSPTAAPSNLKGNLNLLEEKELNLWFNWTVGILVVLVVLITIIGILDAWYIHINDLFQFSTIGKFPMMMI